MSLQENLKKLMMRYGNISISTLAKETKLPQPTLHQLYKGKTKHPRKQTLETLANFFSVSIHQLMGTEVLPLQVSTHIKQQLHLHTTPILSWDELCHWPSQKNFECHEALILENYNSQSSFAIKMVGSSMEPLFPNGCLLIFDSKKTAKDKDWVIIYIKQEQQYSFKRIFFDGNTAYIKSINPEFNELSTLKVSAADRIIATLLEARIKF